MKIENRDIYQSDATEYGYEIAVENNDGDVRLIVNGQSIFCLTAIEAKALANALRTMASMVQLRKKCTCTEHPVYGVEINAECHLHGREA